MMTTKHLVGVPVRAAIVNPVTGEGFLFNPQCLSITYEHHWWSGWTKVLKWPD